VLRKIFSFAPLQNRPNNVPRKIFYTFPPIRKTAETLPYDRIFISPNNRLFTRPLSDGSTDSNKKHKNSFGSSSDWRRLPILSRHQIHRIRVFAGHRVASRPSVSRRLKRNSPDFCRSLPKSPKKRKIIILKSRERRET